VIKRVLLPSIMREWLRAWSATVSTVKMAFSILKWKGKGDLYGGMERNSYIQTGPNFVNVL